MIEQPELSLPSSSLPLEREKDQDGQDWQVRRRSIVDGYQSFLSTNMEGEALASELQVEGQVDNSNLDLDLPVALRRRKRRCSTLAPSGDSQDTISVGAIEGNQTEAATVASTPSRTRRKKRVRFSAPGPSTATAIATPSRRAASGTTGLTPFIGRTTLSSSNASRRYSAPIGTPHPILITNAFDQIDYNSIQTVQFTPLRQVLDERCKRRIRRNGLSEEMNEYEADRREKERPRKEIEVKNEELRCMKEELEKQKAVDNVPVEAKKTQSIDEVEEELRVLRRSMEEHVADDNGVILVPDSMQARDADDDMIQIFEDNDDATTEPFDSSSVYRSALINQVETRDATTSADLPDLRQDAELLTMALDLEKAKQEKREVFKEWRKHFSPSKGIGGSTTGSGLNFQDTPSRAASTATSFSRSLPSPPPNFLQQLSSKLKATTTRAEDAELALCALETELRTLGFVGKDGLDIVAEIKGKFRAARLELERVVPGETTFGFDGNRNLLPELLKNMKQLLHQVRDREAELRTLNDQHRALKGNFDHACISIEKAAKKIGDLEDTVDTNAEELLDMRIRVQEVEREESEKEKTVQTLVQALEKYRADVARLEQLITTMEAEEPFKIHSAQEQIQLSMTADTAEIRDKLSAEEQARQAAENMAAQRLHQIEQLQSAFEAATNHAKEMQLQVNKLQAQKEEEDFKVKRTLHEKGEQHQAQLGSLNAKISNLSTAVEEANADVAKLKAAKDRLEARLKAEIEQGQRAVEAMQHELIRSLAKVNESRKSYLRGTKIRYANSEIEQEEMERESSPSSSSAPMTPVSLVRFADVEMERGKGKMKIRRRRYDSGVGMSSGTDEGLEEEIETSDAEVQIAESVEDHDRCD